MVIKVALLVVFFAVMIGIGIYTRKHATNVDGFVLGSRSAGPWITAFAYGTSYFSAVVFVGYAGQFGWKFGIASTWIGLGNAVIGSYLAWLILGRRTRVMTQAIDAKTMPDFFGKRFDSNALRVAASLITFVFLIPYTASVYNGLSRLFESAFHIDYSICIIVMAVLTAIYVILGGYKATTINDFIQGIIMLAGIVAVIVCVLNKQGGFSNALEGLAAIPTADGKTGVYNTVFGPDPINLIGVIILTSLGTWGLPQMVTKFYAIKDDAAIKRGAIISTVFAVVIAGGSYFLGGFGHLFATASSEEAASTGKYLVETLPSGKLNFDSIVPAMLDSALPDILIGIVIVLVFSASMSTLSSLVLTSSSTLTIDLIKPLASKKMDEDKQVSIMRVLIAAFLLVSVVLALNKNAYITTLMSISWGALAGSFLAPFLYGLFSKKITKAAVWTSFACGSLITVAHMFIFSLGLFPAATKAVADLGWKINILSPINCGAFVMILGLILVPIVSALTKNSREDQEYIDTQVFNCFEK
jgi:SSS family solute:Na+ symporter